MKMDPEIVQESMGFGEISGIFNEILSYGSNVLKNGVTIPFSSQPVDLDQLDPSIDVFDLVPEPEPPSSSTHHREDDLKKIRETEKPAAAKETVKYEETSEVGHLGVNYLLIVKCNHFFFSLCSMASSFP